MDRQLQELLQSILETEPHLEINDKHRKALVLALLGLSPPEKYAAIWKFGQSISEPVTRSEAMNLLARHASQYLEFGFAEKIAKSIVDPYWRLSALVFVASDLLRRDLEVADKSSIWHDTAFRLFGEVERSLQDVPEDSGDRDAVVWALGLALVNAGELGWAENVASGGEYSAERSEVLLRVARARIARDERNGALQAARTISRMANSGSGFPTSRAFDLVEVGKVLANAGSKDEAHLELLKALKFALESQETLEVDGSKCVQAIAVGLAEIGELKAAIGAADKISHLARREETLKKIADISEAPCL